MVGLRLSEIGSLTVDDLRHLPAITWTGKGHRPREATAGSVLCDDLDPIVRERSHQVESLVPSLCLIDPPTDLRIMGDDLADRPFESRTETGSH